MKNNNSSELSPNQSEDHRHHQKPPKPDHGDTEPEKSTPSGDKDIASQSSHPTGTPETTGGWFTDINEHDTRENTVEKITHQHPTGTPDLTGGWFHDEERLTDDDDDDISHVSGEFKHKQNVSSRDENDFPSIPKIDDINLQFPKRVDEIDPGATHVTPSAYSMSDKRQKGTTYKTENVVGRKTTVKKLIRKDDKLSQWQKPLGCILRAVIVLLFIAAFTLIGIVSFIIFKYFSIASTLPDIDNLREQASQFETTRILDRKGNLLYELVDPNAGRRTYTALENISPNLIAATIATEDQDYYTHPGFDVVAILRALWQNYTSGGTVSGASTITQQLARSILLSPSEKSEKSVDRKAKEIVLAAEITRKYSKEEILELYLNEIYYGNQTYGIEAAAETYFNTTADKLSLGQASFLAGLPQAPSVYDIFTNAEETYQRHRDVVILMFQVSQDKNCIEVSTNVQPVCIDATRAAEAIEEIKQYNFQPHEYIINYPHWVNYIRLLLEEKYDNQTIYRSGFTVHTTLDPELQTRAEEMVKQHISSLEANHVTNSALVAIDPSSGEILAMVGSSDFYDESISGQVNMSISPRQPGSAIKPLTYAAAFEKGWTPATLIWDVPSEFPPSGNETDQMPPYVPVNYDDKFHGPVLLRAALANSYNIPAVKTLQFVGIYDNPDIPGADGLINFAQRMGVTTLKGEEYGLSLTLGGGEVTLLELTNAFGIFANGGQYIKPTAIIKITDYLGNTLYDETPKAGEQIMRQEHAFLISSILSDNTARSPMFGQDSVLNLPFTSAVKTGTTNDFRDNWTIGYTPDIVIGVWVGNADYTPMLYTTGLSGAAPIWSEFMKYAIQELAGNNPTPFLRPAGIIERTICAVSGTEPSEWCPKQVAELFAYDQPPLSQEEDLWIKTKIDTWTGYKASAACSDYSEEKYAMNIDDQWAIEWLKNSTQGQQWLENQKVIDSIFFLPTKECEPGDPRPIIEFPGLYENQLINSSPVDIYAIVNATQYFSHYHLDYGIGESPEAWYRLLENQNNPITQPEKIYSLDVSDLPQGVITFRIILHSTIGTSAEQRIHLNLNVPTKTPTTIPTMTQTASPTSTPSPTMSETPTLQATTNGT